MINVKLNGSSLNLSEKTLSPIVVESQLDTSLDSGTVKYLATESDGSPLNDALASYSIGVGGENFDFVGMDSRALVCRKSNGQNVYLHEVSLTEPSKLLQGVMIDGFGVTQPEKIIMSNINRTARQSSTIQTYASSSVYIHQVSGSITVPNCQAIVSTEWTVDGSATGVPDPIVEMDAANGVISWYTPTWRDSSSRAGNKYTVIIMYVCAKPNAATLEDVVNRLLMFSPFDGQRFTLTDDYTVLGVLQSVVSPEFKWNTQTTLWECLLQIGAVIDAVPRLVMDGDGKYTVVTFDFVNAFGNKADNISDQWTNADGQNINEGLYNTALSAVVENLRESD